MLIGSVACAAAAVLAGVLAGGSSGKPFLERHGISDSSRQAEKPKPVHGHPSTRGIPGRILSHRAASGQISSAVLGPVTNGWVTATRRKATDVYAGGDAQQASNGMLVVFRDNHIRVRQTADNVVIPGAGPVRITRAPLGRRVERWAQKRGNVKFVSRRGVHGTLHLKNDTVTLH